MKRILIRTSAALAAMFAVTVAAMPAQAQSSDAQNVMQNGQATKSNSDRKRYCIVETPTGSAIPVKTCKTRKEWQAEGVEIPANL